MHNFLFQDILLQTATTGAYLWKQLEGGATAAALADKLAAEYGQNPEDVLSDVESFLQKAAAQGLIV